MENGDETGRPLLYMYKLVHVHVLTHPVVPSEEVDCDPSNNVSGKSRGSDEEVVLVNPGIMILLIAANVRGSPFGAAAVLCLIQQLGKRRLVQKHRSSSVNRNISHDNLFHTRKGVCF